MDIAVDRVPLSLKVRVTAGCFHREHSPEAYELIDSEFGGRRFVERDGCDVVLVEHENGPELLVELALVTAGLGVAKSLIDLVVAIVNARAEGIRRGDRPAEPVELIVRRSDGAVEEETILRVGARDSLDPDEVERHLNAAIERIGREHLREDERG